MRNNPDTPVPEGVVIPPEAVERSNELKQRHRTLRQLPIYRDMSNLKFMVVRLFDMVPRKMTKYVDMMIQTVGEAKKCVGFAEASRDQQVRADYLSTARVFVEDLQDDVTILRKMNMIDKNTEKAMKSLAKSVVAQSIRWRDYKRPGDEMAQDTKRNEP